MADISFSQHQHGCKAAKRQRPFPSNPYGFHGNSWKLTHASEGRIMPLETYTFWDLKISYRSCFCKLVQPMSFTVLDTIDLHNVMYTKERRLQFEGQQVMTKTKKDS